MSFSPSIFRANDIRGVFKKDFDFDFLKNLSFGVSMLLKEKSVSVSKILVGYDSRLSSPVLAEKLVKELFLQGAFVWNVGLSPSPLCYFLLHHYNLDAALIVTASHNPAEDNGFKIMLHKKFKEFDPIKKIKNIVLQKHKTQNTKEGGFFEEDSLSPYVMSLKKEFSLPSCSFVVDAGNGALGPLAKKVFSEFNLTPHMLFFEPDGRFPHHHPDPSIEENLKSISKKILETKSSFGIAFDGDGDRLTLLNNKGHRLFGDEFGALFFEELLKKSKKPIVGDVKCSDWFFKNIQKLGGESFKTPSGHKVIREALLKKEVQFAVDFSGHIFFNDKKDRGFDDALYASLRFLELFSNNKNLNLNPERFFGEGEVRCFMSQNKISNCLKKIEEHLQKNKESWESLDGLRVSRKGSWFLFRESKTQNALTYRLEAETNEELKTLKKELSLVLGFKL